MEYPLNDDIELAKQIAEGNEDAFSQYYARYYPLIRAFIIRNVRSQAEADDILQLIFLRVWVNRDKLPLVQQHRAWLFTIASREYLRYLRGAVLLEKTLEEAVSSTVVNPSSDMSDYISFKELHRLIQDAVGALSEQRKRVYQLSRDKHMTIDEIAAALQISPKTVKNTLTAALSEIRSFLKMHNYTISTVVLYLFLLHS